MQAGSKTFVSMVLGVALGPVDPSKRTQDWMNSDQAEEQQLLLMPLYTGPYQGAQLCSK